MMETLSVKSRCCMHLSAALNVCLQRCEDAQASATWLALLPDASTGTCRRMSTTCRDCSNDLLEVCQQYGCFVPPLTSGCGCWCKCMVFSCNLCLQGHGGGQSAVSRMAALCLRCWCECMVFTCSLCLQGRGGVPANTVVKVQQCGCFVALNSHVLV